MLLRILSVHRELKEHVVHLDKMGPTDPVDLPDLGDSPASQEVLVYL